MGVLTLGVGMAGLRYRTIAYGIPSSPLGMKFISIWEQKGTHLMSLKSCPLLIALPFWPRLFIDPRLPFRHSRRQRNREPAPNRAWKWSAGSRIRRSLDRGGRFGRRRHGEIVSAENFNREDTHYTSAVAAHRLDGSVLWHWGNPDAGRKTWHHDVACQIHDWDGDGKNEVVVCDQRDIVELDGATGAEKRRIPIAEGATDCLVFCDLAGRGRPEEVLVKDRYHQIWAYDHDWNELWTVRDPGGYRTAHQPRPIDLDGDGKDEIMAGYALLNSDGTVRWVYRSSVDLSKGHLDCCRVVRQGKTPKSSPH